MSTTLETHFVVTDRVVLTYERNGWPAAVVTGYEDAEGDGFHVEHVIVFPGGALRRLVEVGLEEAWRRYEWVSFSMPQAFPLRTKLIRLARRLGFTQYATHHSFDFFVRYRP